MARVKAEYDVTSLSKGTVDKYLRWRRQLIQYPLPDPFPDDVYQELLYRAANPGSKRDDEPNLTAEGEKLTKHLLAGTRNFYRKNRRGPIY